MSMPGIGGGAPLSQQQQDYLATAAMAMANNRLQRALDIPTFMKREYGARASNMMRNLNPAFMTQTANPYKGYDPNQFMSSGEYAAAQEYINSMAPQTGEVAPGVDQYGIFKRYGLNNPGAQGQSYTAPQMEALNRAYEAYMARTVLGQAPVQAPKLPAVEQPIREIIPPGAVRTPGPQPARQPLPVPQMRAPAPVAQTRPQNMLMPAQPVGRPAPVPVQAITGRTPATSVSAVNPPLMTRPNVAPLRR